jgi:hypothetical protein
MVAMPMVMMVMMTTTMMMLIVIASEVVGVIVIASMRCDDDVASTVLKSPSLQPRPSVRYTTLHDSASHSWHHRSPHRRTFHPSNRVVLKGGNDISRRLLRPIHAIRHTKKEIRAVGFQIRVPELQLAHCDAKHVGDLAAVVAGLDGVVSKFVDLLVRVERK